MSTPHYAHWGYGVTQHLVNPYFYIYRYGVREQFTITEDEKRELEELASLAFDLDVFRLLYITLDMQPLAALKGSLNKR